MLVPASHSAVRPPVPPMCPHVPTGTCLMVLAVPASVLPLVSPQLRKYYRWVVLPVNPHNPDQENLDISSQPASQSEL